MLIINDEENHDIPDFWGECNDRNLIGPIYNLRSEGKRDLYGLCSPTRVGQDIFEYGIGVLVDEDTSEFDFEEMKKAGYSIWDVKQKQIMKYILKKEEVVYSVNCGFR